MRRHNWAFAVAACLLGMVSGAMAQSVTDYHADPGRSGNYTVAGLTLAAAATMTPDKGFAASFTGNVYAQPLYWQSKTSKFLIVATTSNIVYALNADTGAMMWQKTLAAPAARANLPCGNIDPEGVVGTPVIDPVGKVLYLDALTAGTGSGPRHVLYALDVTNGAILSGWPLDVGSLLTAAVPSFTSAPQGQRAALSFYQGNLYIPYGGKYGDCGTYNGIVAQVNMATRAVAGVWATRAHGGGIWAPGGLSRFGSELFATTGNTMGASGWQDGEAVVRLRPGLTHSLAAADYFAPGNWLALDDSDADLGGTAAIGFTVQDARGHAYLRLLALGKDGNGYVLNGADLGGIGGAIQTQGLSTAQIKNAPAIYPDGSKTYVFFTNNNGIGSNCSGNNITAVAITVLHKSPLRTAWCGSFSGDGAPIVTTSDGTHDPIVWVSGAEGDNKLHGFNGLTGAVLFTSASSMAGLRHFSTPVAANGHIYLGADGKVYSFSFTPG
jgi:hypothetical protein